MVEDLLTCLHKIHPDETPLSHHLTFGIVMLIVTFTSLAMNVVITIIIFRTNAVEKLVRPYIFGMVAASVIFLLTNCWALLPTILFNLHINDPYNAILATPNSIGYLMIMFTTTTMAFDRFLIFFAPKVHQSLTSNTCTFYLFTAIPCIMALIFTAHMNILGCRKRVNPYTLSYSYSCSDCGFYDLMLHIFAFAFPAINFIIYIAVFIKIRKMKSIVATKSGPSLSHVNKKDIKLVIQFLLICAAQFASSVAFYVLPPIAGGHDIAFYMTAIFSTLNTMTNPCVIFVFQPRVRKAVHLFTTGKLGDVSTVVSKVPTAVSKF